MSRSVFTLCVLWTILVYVALGVIALNLDVIDAFISGAPRDFPWEDVFDRPLADKMYQISDTFEAARDYFAAIAEDGDYLNDWLTHLPRQDLFLAIGKVYAGLISV